MVALAVRAGFKKPIVRCIAPGGVTELELYEMRGLEEEASERLRNKEKKGIVRKRRTTVAYSGKNRETAEAFLEHLRHPTD